MAGPLDGVRVIDFTQVVAGPFGAMMLADQGADVIKVEPLTAFGDLTRGLPAFAKGGMPALFVNNNRGKRCVAIDLQTDEGRQVALDLCRDADVVFQNFRPGAMARLGLDYDSIAAINPNVIYCSISGFGPDGPYSDRPVLDPVIQAHTGMISRQLNPDVPFPDLVRNLVADKSSGMTATQAITAALFARERGAGGQHIEVPMLDSTMYFFWPDGMMDKSLIDEDASGGFLLSTIYRLTDCSDGKIVYFVASDPMRLALFDALGHPEWAEDPRFESMVALSAPGNFEALGALLVESFLQLTVEEAVEKLLAHSVPCGPVLDADQALADPQIVHNETVQRFTHPDAGTIQAARPAARFDKTPAELATLLAHRGEHNAEILAEIGRSPEEIAALTESGTIGT
ncbi:MAG: CoA transferase [Actinomycetota bacterium]